MRRNYALLISCHLLLMVLLLAGCVNAVKPAEADRSAFVAVSKGLPLEGMWRQNIELADINGDGLLDIVAPPPRKATEAQQHPFIFIRGNNESEWQEADYWLHGKARFNYGGIAVGDLNADGSPDMVLAIHTGKIVILLNERNSGFRDVLLPAGDFFSRTVAIADVNGDGWNDVIALSEAPFIKSYKAKGLMVALNRKGEGWDTKFFGGETDFFGDSFAVGDINGDGNKDLATAPLVIRKKLTKVLWLGDGSGSFEAYGEDFLPHGIPAAVRISNDKGERPQKVAFILSELGRKAKVRLAVFQWDGQGLRELSAGIKTDRPFALDFCDLNGDGMEELIVMSENGLSAYSYDGKEWSETAHRSIPRSEAIAVQDLRAERDSDGSVIIVCNLASEDPALSNGLRAYMLKPAADSGRSIPQGRKESE